MTTALGILTARLFRQTNAGNWREVVACVQQEMRNLIAQPRAASNGV